jgi:plastocyanin domain-containing protein
MNQRVKTALLLLTLTNALPWSLAQAADSEFRLVIKDHKFSPTQLVVPAGQKIRITVENQDPTPEEFESYDFNREKVVPGNGRIVVFVGPLQPGKYEFFGEFNPATARGWIVAQ